MHWDHRSQTQFSIDSSAEVCYKHILLPCSPQSFWLSRSWAGIYISTVAVWLVLLGLEPHFRSPIFRMIIHMGWRRLARSQCSLWIWPLNVLIYLASSSCLCLLSQCDHVSLILKVLWSLSRYNYMIIWSCYSQIYLWLALLQLLGTALVIWTLHLLAVRVCTDSSVK